MDEEDDSLRREDLPSDVLRKIFESFNDTSDSTWAIARVRCSVVCRAWRSILCDPQLWNTIDLSTMESDFIRIQIEPYVWLSTRTESRLNCVLNSALSLDQQGKHNRLDLQSRLVCSRPSLHLHCRKIPESETVGYAGMEQNPEGGNRQGHCLLERPRVPYNR